MDEKDLKINALLERVAQLTQEYENKVADYRVALTQQSQNIESLQQKVQELEAENVTVQSTEETADKN